MRVTALSNSPGSFQNSVYIQSELVTTNKATGSHSEKTYSTLGYTKSCYKSPLLTGHFDSKGFRQPTPYQRWMYESQGYDFGYIRETSTQLQDYSGRSGGGHFGAHFSTGGFKTSSFISGNSPGDPFNLRGLVETEALNKLKQQKIHLGESLAEARTAVNGVARDVSTLARALLAMRKGNFSLAAYHLGLKRSKSGAASDVWLSYLYGWLPLINDIYGGVEQLRTGFRKEGLEFSVVRRKSTRPPWPLSAGRPANKAVWKPSNSYKLRGECKLYGRIADDFWSAATSIGLENPLYVAWALVPYSFVIDWVLPVGDVLSALTASNGIQFVGGYSTLNLEVEQDVEFCQYVGVTGNLPRTTSKLKAVDRQVFTDWPSPSLYIKSPFSSTHVISALALLTQLSR